jgi:serine/threonine protein kinase
MSSVYRAYDRQLGCEVAIKWSNEWEPGDLHPLVREFHQLAALTHPNLVQPYELFADGIDSFFTMELVEGTDFVSFVRGSTDDGSVDYGRLREAARQLAHVMRSVHAAGVVHRDVKPSNVLVTRDGRVVLVDFGLAQRLSDSLEIAGSGVLLGTRGYVAPEQARGETIGKATDWYSFGVTLFEAITGRLPFKNMFEALVAPRSPNLVPSIRRYVPSAPLDLDELIVALLDPCAGRRPGGDDVVRVLELHDQAEARAPFAEVPRTSRANPMDQG